MSNKTKAEQQKKAQLDQAKIQSLQQELLVVKREKKFIQDKLERVTGSMENQQHEMLLNIERSKADVAEKGRLQLVAELDLIRKQLDMEHENIQRCKKFLEPEEMAKMSDPEKAVSPSSLE